MSNGTKNPTKEPIKKTNTMKLIELKFGADLHELLRKDYMDSHMSIEQLADKYKVTPCTAHRWLKMYDIPRRKITFV